MSHQAVLDFSPINQALHIFFSINRKEFCQVWAWVYANVIDCHLRKVMNMRLIRHFLKISSSL